LNNADAKEEFEKWCIMCIHYIWQNALYPPAYPCVLKLLAANAAVLQLSFVLFVCSFSKPPKKNIVILIPVLFVGHIGMYLATFAELLKKGGLNHLLNPKRAESK
jgi:hypothetical protein